MNESQDKTFRIISGVNLGAGTVYTPGMEAELLQAASEAQLQHLAAEGAILMDGVEPPEGFVEYGETTPEFRRILDANLDFPMTVNSVRELQAASRLKRGE